MFRTIVYLLCRSAGYEIVSPNSAKPLSVREIANHLDTWWGTSSSNRLLSQVFALALVRELDIAGSARNHSDIFSGRCHGVIFRGVWEGWRSAAGRLPFRASRSVTIIPARLELRTGCIVERHQHHCGSGFVQES